MQAPRRRPRARGPHRHRPDQHAAARRQHGAAADRDAALQPARGPEPRRDRAASPTPRSTQFDIRAAGPEARTGTLSGGNLQKALLARELACEPMVLLAAQPTRGLDVARHRIRPRPVSRPAGARRCACILISEDLEELFELADRIAVMFEGRIVDVLPVAEADGRADRPADGRRAGGGSDPAPARAARGHARLARPRCCRSRAIAGDAGAVQRARRAGRRQCPRRLSRICSRARSAAASTSSRPLVKAAPLVLTGLAVAVAFRAKFWNIGGEGQLLAGAMAAAFVGAREGLPGLVAGPADDPRRARSPARPARCRAGRAAASASRSTTSSPRCCSTSSSSTA